MEKKYQDTTKKSTTFRKKFIDYYKKYIEYIEKRNKKFNALSREKRIVALCQDAIYQILMGTIKPTSGTYLQEIGPKEDLLSAIDFTNSFYNAEEHACSLFSEVNNISGEKQEDEDNERSFLWNKQFQTSMPLVSCDACAKGGLMVAAISFKNKLSISDSETDSPQLPKILEDDFTKAEWDLIEICFERWSVSMARSESNFSEKIKKVDKTFADFTIKVPKFVEGEYYEDEEIYYGLAYAIKHLDASILECNEDDGILSQEKVESLLLQIYCTIIAHRGNIFKALNIKNNKIIDYKKIITDAHTLYPAFKTKKELNARIKELTEFIRKKPLSLKELNETLSKEIFI